jgi:hypothetical protein
MAFSMSTTVPRMGLRRRRERLRCLGVDGGDDFVMAVVAFGDGL